MKIRTNYKLPLAASVFLLATSQLNLVQAEGYPYSNQNAQPVYNPGYQNYPGNLTPGYTRPYNGGRNYGRDSNFSPMGGSGPSFSGPWDSGRGNSMPWNSGRGGSGPGFSGPGFNGPWDSGRCPGTVDVVVAGQVSAARGTVVAVVAACHGAAVVAVAACHGMIVDVAAGWIKTDLQIAGMTC